MYTIEWKASPNFYANVRSEEDPPQEPPLIVLHTMDGFLEGTLVGFKIPHRRLAVIMELEEKVKFINM